MADRLKAAELLDKIASERIFDERKYVEFNLNIGSDKVDPILGAASNELTELYTTWTHMGARLKESDKLNQELTGEVRTLLHLFARAIRAGISEYKSKEGLRKQLDERTG